jgi:hypothetical protein
MGDGDGTTSPPVKSYPPPSPIFAPPPPPKVLNLVTAAAAATAGFLGYCEVAGILALLSLVFGFWDLFQTRYMITPPPEKTGDPRPSDQTPPTRDPRNPEPRMQDREERPPSYR